jgi:hypothetical protein
LTTSLAGMISVISPTPWPAYMAMLSISPVAVAFGTVPANRRISLCWSQELFGQLSIPSFRCISTKCAIEGAISDMANYCTKNPSCTNSIIYHCLASIKKKSFGSKKSK